MFKSYLYIRLFWTLFGMFTDNKVVHGHTLIDRSTTPSMNKTNEIRSINNPKSHESESDGIRCFKCTSWENTLCGVSVYKFTALRNFPTVYCDDDCIKIVVKHDGITDVIRGCSTGSEIDDYTCDSNYCNNGHSLQIIFTTFLTSILCSFSFL